MRVIAIATIGLVITGAAVAQEQKPAPPNTAAAPSVNEAAPVVNAEADRALKEMGAYIASAEQFTFHADTRLFNATGQAELSLECNTGSAK